MTAATSLLRLPPACHQKLLLLTIGRTHGLPTLKNFLDLFLHPSLTCFSCKHNVKLLAYGTIIALWEVARFFPPCCWAVIDGKTRSASAACFCPCLCRQGPKLTIKQCLSSLEAACCSAGHNSGFFLPVAAARKVDQQRVSSLP